MAVKPGYPGFGHHVDRFRSTVVLMAFCWWGWLGARSSAQQPSTCWTGLLAPQTQPEHLWSQHHSPLAVAFSSQAVLQLAFSTGKS